MYRRRGRAVPSDGELRALKARLCRVLAPLASAVLLDAELGGDALAEVPPRVALLMPLEAQGYEAVAEGPAPRLLPDFSPADAARLGADGCKLLIPYRPDLADATERQDALVRETLAACHALGLPLMVEPIVYRLDRDDEAAFRAAFADRVVATARRVAALGVDILKLQFPESRDPRAACAELDRACGASPWVLLGGGTDADAFASQLDVACRAGASGFAVGRTAWDAALADDPAESERRIAETCAPVLARFVEIAERHARRLGA